MWALSPRSWSVLWGLTAPGFPTSLPTHTPGERKPSSSCVARPGFHWLHSWGRWPYWAEVSPRTREAQSVTEWGCWLQEVSITQGPGGLPRGCGLSQYLSLGDSAQGGYGPGRLAIADSWGFESPGS